MTGKKQTDIVWRHTSVIVRADIFSRAHEQGIDISHVCNKALADLLGVDYCQEQLENVPVPRPVIIAQNSPPTEEKECLLRADTTTHSPVINADDPTASMAVKSAKRQVKVKTASKEMARVPSSLPAPENMIPHGSAKTASAEKTQKPAGVKLHKDEGLKKFIATKLIRSDTSDAVVSKDDMYQAFTRFCREHKFSPVPDRKIFTVALKNRFAFFDKTINGTPSWVNVRLH